MSHTSLITARPMMAAGDDNKTRMMVTELVLKLRLNAIGLRSYKDVGKDFTRCSPKRDSGDGGIPSVVVDTVEMVVMVVVKGDAYFSWHQIHGLDFFVYA